MGARAMKRIAAILIGVGLSAGLVLGGATAARADRLDDLYSQFDAGDVAGARQGLLAQTPDGRSDQARAWLLTALVALKQDRLVVAGISLDHIDMAALPAALRPRADAARAALRARLDANPALRSAVTEAARRAYAQDMTRAFLLGQTGQATKLFAEEFIEGHFGASQVGRFDDATLFVPQRTDTLRVSGQAAIRHRLAFNDTSTWEVGASVSNQFYLDEQDLDYLGLGLSGRYSKLMGPQRVLHLQPFVARDFSGDGVSGLSWRGGASASLVSQLSPGRILSVTGRAQVIEYDQFDTLDGWRADLETAYSSVHMLPGARVSLRSVVSFQDAQTDAFDRVSVSVGPAVTWFDVLDLADVTADASVGGAWHQRKDTVQTTEVRRDLTLAAGLEAAFPLAGDDLALVARGRYFRQSSTIGRQDYDSGIAGLGLRWRY